MATKGKNSATKNGENFQANVTRKLQDPKFLKNVLGLDNAGDVEDIDSKDKNNSYKSLRIELLKKFLEINDKMPRINVSSAFKGDLLNLIAKKIIDIKNYDGIKNMKFPENENPENFIKSIDSNIKYALFYKLNNFFHQDLKDLCDFYSYSKNIEWYNSMIEKYKTSTTICTTTKAKLIDLFLFMEFGYGWDMSGSPITSNIKGFISQVEDSYQYKEVNLQESLDDSEIRVNLMFDEKGYVYIYFYQNDVCVYIMSQRGPKDKYQGNCSFINRKHLNIVSTVKM